MTIAVVVSAHVGPHFSVFVRARRCCKRPSPLLARARLERTTRFARVRDPPVGTGISSFSVKEQVISSAAGDDRKTSLLTTEE
jgi:hypothetical protein